MQTTEVKQLRGIINMWGNDMEQLYDVTRIKCVSWFDSNGESSLWDGFQKFFGTLKPNLVLKMFETVLENVSNRLEVN